MEKTDVRTRKLVQPGADRLGYLLMSVLNRGSDGTEPVRRQDWAQQRLIGVFILR